MIGNEVVVSDARRQGTIVRRLLALLERSGYQEVARSPLVMLGFTVRVSDALWCRSFDVLEGFYDSIVANSFLQFDGTFL